MDLFNVGFEREKLGLFTSSVHVILKNFNPVVMLHVHCTCFQT